MSRGVYRLKRHQSPFCIKSQAPTAFEKLFELSRPFDAPLVLSYSPFDASTRARPRVMSVDDIQVIARRFYRRVSVDFASPLTHSKLNRTDLNVEGSRRGEIFVTCQI